VLRELPAENFGTVAAGIVTFSLGLRGLTPWRSLRCWVENFPKPVKLTSPPFFSVSVIESSTASTASAASRLDRFAFWATLSTNSCLVTIAPLFPLWLADPRRKTLAGFGFRLNHAVFAASDQLGGTKKGLQADPFPGKGLRSSLLAVDHADRR